MLRPVQTMISLRPGRISFTSFREARMGLALRRRPPFGASASTGWMSPLRIELEALDDVARIGEAAADEVGEERGCVGSECLGWLHGAVSFVPVRESGSRMSSPGTSDRRPAHGRPLTLKGVAHFAGDLDEECRAVRLRPTRSVTPGALGHRGLSCSVTGGEKSRLRGMRRLKQEGGCEESAT